MVPMVICGNATINFSKIDTKSTTSSSLPLWLISLRIVAATFSSKQAPAILVSTESVNSPAALRVNVKATMLSGSIPIATNPMMRLPS